MPAQRRKSQLGATGGAESSHDEAEHLEEIGVARAAQLLGQAAEPRDRIVLLVQGAGSRICIGCAEQPPGLGDKQEDKTVDQSQELPVVVVDRQGAVPQTPSQFGVGGMGEEARSQRGDGLLHAFPQAVEGTRALFAGDLRPPLEPAVRRPFGIEA